MTSLVLTKLGMLSLNIDERMNQYKSHGSYAGKIFNFENLVHKIVPTVFSGHISLISEYLSNLVQIIIFGCLLYLSLSTLSYIYFFKLKKERFLPKYNGENLIWNDIKWSIINIVGESFLVAALRMTLPRYSLVYYQVSDYGVAYLILSIFLHMLFDETLTYWVHRIFHTNKYLYKYLHKIHHKSVDITPYSGFAFHPLDAFGQAFPTFISCYFFPLHYDILLFFSVITSMWAISIHDNVPALPIKLFLYSTHHTIHHERGIGKFRNYGKFTSIWDRLAGTYSDPDRINYGWERNENTSQFFKKINSYIDKYIPDRTKRFNVKEN